MGRPYFSAFPLVPTLPTVFAFPLGVVPGTRGNVIAPGRQTVVTGFGGRIFIRLE